MLKHTGPVVYLNRLTFDQSVFPVLGHEDIDCIFQNWLQNNSVCSKSLQFAAGNEWDKIPLDIRLSSCLRIYRNKVKSFLKAFRSTNDLTMGIYYGQLSKSRWLWQNKSQPDQKFTWHQPPTCIYSTLPVHTCIMFRSPITQNLKLFWPFNLTQGPI